MSFISGSDYFTDLEQGVCVDFFHDNHRHMLAANESFGCLVYLCWGGIHQVLQTACVLKCTVSLVFVPVSMTWRITAMPTDACGYALNS